MRFTQRVICIFGVLALLGGCKDDKYTPFGKNQDLIDPSRGLSRSDYKNANNLASNLDLPDHGTVSASVAAPPVPDLAEILTAPKPPKIASAQLVSIAVTDDVPLKDVLIELARLANVDIEVDSGITGGITFRAKDRPFNEVIERIAALADLRYKVKNNVLRVERDTPYIEIYSLDLLNIDRSSTGNIGVNTSPGSGGRNSSSGGGGGSSAGSSGGVNSGSTSNITAKADSDFWRQFEESLKQILGYVPVNRASSTTIAMQPVNPAAVGPGENTPVPAATPAPAPAPAAPAPSNNPTGASTGGDKPFYILNKQASTLTVSASEKQHDVVKRFLEKIQQNSSAQVLIEAKIVEVSLDDEFQSGINWTRLGGKAFSMPLKFGGVPNPTSDAATININKLDIGGTGIDLSAAVTLVETFGATRTLSSPRLHATNNQQAVLSFAENYVYYELKIDQQTNSTSAGSLQDTKVTSILHTVPIGIILSLQPSIDSDNNEVTLNVRPTLSRITGFITDPAVAYAAAQAKINIDSKTPIVEVREMDSILKLKSGQVMVIGGLMQDKSDNKDSGVPYLSRVPYVGNLFKGVSKVNNMSELVIFIRATIVDSHGNYAPGDKALYEKFIPDARPLTF